MIINPLHININNVLLFRDQWFYLFFPKFFLLSAFIKGSWILILFYTPSVALLLWLRYMEKSGCMQMKDILIVFTSDCGYFSLILKNLSRLWFLTVSCSVELETTPRNFSYSVTLKVTGLFFTLESSNPCMILWHHSLVIWKLLE